MLTSALIALTDWITNLASRLVPSWADDMNEKVRVQYDRSTIGESVNTNPRDGDHKPLKKFFIPNTLATWPWPRRVNEYTTEVCAESSAWVKSFPAFSPKAQESVDRCKFGKT
jgi:hypothetical protein